MITSPTPIPTCGTLRLLGIILICFEREILGERQSEMRREELICWLEENSRQLKTGTLVINGEKVRVSEKVEARIKTKGKKGRSSLKLRLEWGENPLKGASKTDKGTQKTLSGDGWKAEQKPEKEGADTENGPTARVWDYDSHVFVCAGGDCKKRGSKGVRKALRSELRTSGILGDVRVDTLGCLGLCKHGPNVVVYPEGTWYLGLEEADIPEVVEQHLKGGAPVARLAADRRPRRVKKAEKK
jgi:(2Fe-2S) ferredoxin